MKKKNMKTMITRILACALLVATLGLFLASCTAGDKVKDTANKAWDTAVDGAKRIYDTAKDKITMEQVSGMAAIRLLSAEETVTTPTYAGTLKASDFAAGNWTNTNGKGALYVQSKDCVGTITSVTGATIGDYWFAEPGEKPVVAIDGNNSKLSVLLPAGYTDVATWAAAATDFSITVTPVMEKTLQATVLPESATDKSVTWSVSATEEGVDASEYIRLLTFDGAAENKVTVLALKPFAGHEFRIVCTTNIGGFTAECKVTYEGEASKLYLYMSNSDGSETLMPGLLQTSDSEKPVFLVGSTTDFRLALDNVFHQVGHSANYEVTSISLNGTIKVDKMSYNQTGSKLMETIDNYDISKHVNDFVTVTLEGDTLKVKVDKAIESWIGDALGSSSSGWYYQFNSFAESGMPYFVVSIRDTVSGLCTAVRFHIKSTVQSVSLSENALTF